MSLLFDENLSPRLIRLLEAAYPQSEHVELVGLKGQSDASSASSEAIRPR